MKMQGILTSLVAVVVGMAQAGELKKLKLELPKDIAPKISEAISSGNLENSSIVPTIMVPQGTTNIALKKKVIGSDPFPSVGELEYLTDGNKGGDNESYVELKADVQWMQIDLGEPKTIYAIALWHYHAEHRAYRDVIIQVADDPKFSVNVRTLFNNDHDNSSRMGIGADYVYIDSYAGKLIDAKGIVGRYVRLYSNGSNVTARNHYVEVEVFGE